MTQDVDGDYPAPGESIAVLNRLLRMWHAHDGGASIPLLDGTSLPALAIHVQVEHVAELTESIIELIRHNVYLSTAPLFRLSMECAVNAVWWASDPARVRASVHEAARQSDLFVRSVRRVQPGAFSDSAGMTESIKEFARFASLDARVFERRCRAIQGGAWIYPRYRLLSESSHGGIALLSEYSVHGTRTATNPDGLALVQRPHYRHLELALETQVILFALALAAWESVLPDHPDETELFELANDLGFGDLLQTAIGRPSPGVTGTPQDAG
ncbi:DUF5677 domain-containing protein [Agromyces neolithicus]|uniref:Uncharacterized protein n=1 Tax=Agromyces neolithicus TaxID=269420 RepID=A0ABP4YGE1_9MICO